MLNSNGMEQRNKTLWMVSGGLLFVIVASGATYFLKELSPTTSPRASTTASPGGGTQPQVIATEFPVWKTITLGTYKDDTALHAALVKNKFSIFPRATSMLGNSNFSVSHAETTVDLVVVSVADLGFKDLAVRDDIYKRAQELGLALVPPEVGPQLRLQYKDQAKGEWLVIAMEPIADSDDMYVFGVGQNGDELWLGVHWAAPSRLWSTSTLLVFALPK